MIPFVVTILAIAVVFVVLYSCGIAIYYWYTHDRGKRRKLEAQKARENEETRQKMLAFLRSKSSQLQEAMNQFSRYTDVQTGYFANYQLTTWKDTNAALFDDIKDQTLSELGLSSEELKTVAEFKNDYASAEAIRVEFNKRFVEQELDAFGPYFDTHIEGKPFDLQQRTAIVTDEDNNLVIAGAGTGKTTTILGKVSYVVDRYTTPPSEILLISFTNKSASDLTKRMNVRGVEAKTFHKFGKDVITQVEGRAPSVFDEDRFQSLVIRFFKELMEDSEYLAQVVRFFRDYLKRPRSAFEFQNQGEYIQYLKDQNFKTYKQKEVRAKGRTTYKMEAVKSVEECQIANYLLFNNVDYEYELPYGFDVSSPGYGAYKPDFTIRQNGRTVYLEHLALDRKGNVPPFFPREGETYQAAKARYCEKIDWARQTHQSHGTQLIETYSYEMSEDILFDNLAQRLKDAGIALKPKPPAGVWGIILESGQDEVDGFLTLIQTFITLMKSNTYSFADVVQRNAQIQDSFEKERNALLIAIIEPIYECYERFLAEHHEIDFSDMINRAAAYISEGKHPQRYRYVVIDEFQDISVGRYQLVKAIKDRSPDCKLFCVGDDWQSIYRFTGSDIALFREFEKFFGCTVKSKIETTHRFHEPLIKLSSDFILKNPNQERKALNGMSGTVPRSTDYKIVYSDSDEQDDTLALKQVFDEVISSTSNLGKKRICVLGRYSFDIERLENPRGPFQVDQRTGVICYAAAPHNGIQATIEAQYLTAHKAKGLEDDIVIISNCNSGKYGFPSGMSDDPALNLLLSETDQFENGEERRLFYVAMTLAREKVYFITDRLHKSKFIMELEAQSGNTGLKKCPRCKTADLVRRRGTRNGQSWDFYGCSNYLYGCDYRERLS